MVLKILDLKNARSRAESIKKHTFSKNAHSWAEKVSKPFFFKKIENSKIRFSNLILWWESLKKAHFLTMFFYKNTTRMFTKLKFDWNIFWALPDNKAMTVALFVYQHIYCRYLCPGECIVQDRGELCNKIANLLAERFNCSMDVNNCVMSILIKSFSLISGSIHI